MLSFAVILIVCCAYVKAQDGEIEVSDNKTQCMTQLMDWCNSMQYPQKGVELAMLSITYEDPRGYYRVFCSSDNDGTNCTRNREPWFSCGSDHVMSYMGNVWSNDTSSSDVDDDICATADKAFNEIFVQNLSSTNTTLKKEVEKGMEAFFDQISMMEEQIAMIQEALKKIPYLRDFWSALDKSFAPRGDSGFTTLMPPSNTSTDQTNEIEKE